MLRNLQSNHQSSIASRWLAALSESRADLLDTVSGISHTELHARIAPSAHTVADYLWHVANIALWWTKEVVLGEEIPDAEKSRYGLTQPGDIQRAPVHMELQDFMQLLQESMNLVVRTFSEMTDVELTRLQRPFGSRGDSVTPDWVLYNLLDHEAHHRGQIAMILRLVRDGATGNVRNGES